jgi:hypothetical protein
MKLDTVAILNEAGGRIRELRGRDNKSLHLERVQANRDAEGAVAGVLWLVRCDERHVSGSLDADAIESARASMPEGTTPEDVVTGAIVADAERLARGEL